MKIRKKKRLKNRWVWRLGMLRTLQPGKTMEEYLQKYPDSHPIQQVPTLTRLEYWYIVDRARSVDGCVCKAEGHCEHGYPSWLLALNVFGGNQ